MLINLSIHNYALIDHLEIDFSKGLNIITGETGAGKSILLGALGLVAGKRADKNVVRKDSKKCIVEANFDLSKSSINFLFEKYDLDIEEQCTLRREVVDSGKSRAFVNDTPVNLSILKEFANRLIDIHSQHENLLLLDSSFQLNTIDIVALSTMARDEYQSKYLNYRSLKQELESLIEDNAKSKSDLDYFQFQFDELDQAEIKTNESNELEKELQLLEASNDLSLVLNNSTDQIINDDLNIVDVLQLATNNLNKFRGISDELDLTIDRLNQSQIELKDIGESLLDINSHLSFDPERLTWINDRLDLLNTLMVKHRVDNCDKLIEVKSNIEQKLNDLDSLDVQIEKLESELFELRSSLEKVSNQLSDKRKRSFPKFVKEVKSILSKVGMPDSVVEIGYRKRENFSDFGQDEISFLFSANPGEEAKPVGKIASGGEVSRLMLAIKSLTAKNTTLPTIVFDEIDTGISGEVAGKVGEVMLGMSDNMQLFVITHLPQIASKGNCHFKVFKKINNGITQSSLVQLSEDERIKEVAGMLSGAFISEEALANAKSLLY